MPTHDGLSVYYDTKLWSFRFLKLKDVLVIIFLQREEAAVRKWDPFCRLLNLTLHWLYFLAGGV